MAETATADAPPADQPNGSAKGFKRNGPMKGVPRSATWFATDLPTRLAIRSAYVVNGLSPRDIAAEFGFTPEQIRGLVKREGWTKVKEAAKERLNARLLARAERDTAQIVEAVAVKTEELAVRTLDAASAVLDDKSGDYWAKDLQSLSQAAKNFVGLARQARGMGDASPVSNGNANTAMIFVNCERVGDKPEPKNVTGSATDPRTLDVLPSLAVAMPRASKRPS